MSLLSYTELIELVDSGVINADKKQVNASSIDITLGPQIHRECNVGWIVSLMDNIHPQMYSSASNNYVLEPNEFILASSNEVFNLPNDISAEYKLNSSLARSGLDHLNAGWCDAGWNGSVLTLELKNCLRYQSLKLYEGMKIGQMVFFRHKMVPEDKSYAIQGQYNGDTGVTSSKGLRLF